MLHCARRSRSPVRHPENGHHTQSADTLQHAREAERQPAVTSAQRHRHVSSSGYHNGRLRAAGELRESMSGDDRSEQQPTVRVTRHRAVQQLEQLPVQVSQSYNQCFCVCMHILNQDC
jgi:hypothetical protein